MENYLEKIFIYDLQSCVASTSIEVMFYLWHQEDDLATQEDVLEHKKKQLKEMEEKLKEQVNSGFLSNFSTPHCMHMIFCSHLLRRNISPRDGINSVRAGTIWMQSMM